jgi:hypothetical protein
MSISAVTPIQDARPIVEETQQDLSKKTVCLKLTIGVLGNRRKVSNSKVEVDADKDSIRVSKALLNSKELQAIKGFDGDVRRYVYNTCLPFETGVHLLPFPLIENADKRLREFADKRKILVDAFIEAYPRLVEEAVTRLRAIYDPKDYASVEAVRQKFSFTWRYVNFGVPGQLRNISAEIFREEREKAAKMMQEASVEIQAVMRETLAELVKHLSDRLQDGGDGKPKQFRESTVTNLKDFLDSFDFRNVVDDQELKEQVEKARALVSGITGEQIRSTDTLRANLKAGISEISTKLAGMVIDKDKPRRQLHFDEV